MVQLKTLRVFYVCCCGLCFTYNSAAWLT